MADETKSKRGRAKKAEPQAATVAAAPIAAPGAAAAAAAEAPVAVPSPPKPAAPASAPEAAVSAPGQGQPPGQPGAQPGQRVMTLPEGVAALRELQKGGRLEEARRLGHALLRAAPANAEIFTLAASTEMSAGRPDLALTLVERAASLDASSAERFAALGKVLRALGRDVDAAGAYERALTIHANSPPRIDPTEFARRNPSHVVQARPVNHVQFRKSKHFDQMLTGWLEGRAGGDSDDLARFYFLADNVTRTLARGVDGALAELGVWRGATAKVMRAAAPGRMLYLFDTFKGFPPGSFQQGDPRAELYKDTALDAVRNYVGSDEAHYMTGTFPETAAGVPANTRFCFVHIDANLGESVKAGLEFFYPRLNKGALLVLHDYGNDHWPHVAQTADDFLADKPEGLVLLTDKGGTGVLIKQ